MKFSQIKKTIANTGLVVRVRSFFAQDFFQNAIVRWLLISSLVANLIIWFGLKIFIVPVDLPIILHYNVYFGVDMLGDWRQVYILPLLGLILLIINLSLALHFYSQKERIASHILLMATLMLQLSLLVAAISVIIINY
ncbi:MAG: hypothetical protein WC238_03965 [Parcubacteria group bacterium]|jgi:hypothetical protein